MGKYGNSEISMISPGNMARKKLNAILFARVNRVSSFTSS